MMKKKAENKRKGLIGTIVFHLVLLIIFLFTGLTMPVPLPDEKGLPVQLDLGNVDFGSGDVQPQTTTPQEVSEPVTEPVETTPQEVEEEVATQTESAPISAPKETEKKEVKEEKKLDDRLKKAIQNPFESTTDNESQGEGDTKKPGDQGKKDGSPTGNSSSGDKIGGGTSLVGFGGRGFRNRPRVQGNWQESGVIIVDVIFDRNGNYVRATAGVRGTTITNAAMIKAVEESVRKATIDPDPDGPAEKKGEIRFVFTLE